jgi:molecular chaperone DnaK
MARTLAIDFGTNNTVVALYDGENGEAKIVQLQDWSRPVHSGANYTQCPTEWVIPSLIHYLSGGECVYGYQVRKRNLIDSPATIRWMRHYIQMGSPVRVPIDDSDIDYLTAGIDFLVPVIRQVVQEYRLKGNEVAFTIPLEASHKYKEWIGTVAAQAGIARYRLIDEASAAMFGYRVPMEKETAVMIFDFGGSNMEVSIVVPEIGAQESHRICRILGRAWGDLGGATIDHWLAEEVIGRMGLRKEDLSRGSISEPVREAFERAKEQLSSENDTHIIIPGIPASRTPEISFSRHEFEVLLNAHELYPRIHKTIERALHAAAQKGFSEDQIGYILMVGGSSSIPAVQNALKERFGCDRVFCSHPCSAVASGAALFMGGQEPTDYINHDYGIRFWNSQTGEYDYRIIVRRGTCFPSGRKTIPFFVKATYEGQTHLGISVYEMGTGSGSNELRELIHEPGGGYRLVETASENQNEGKKVNLWMNERDPTLLIANPPAKKGEIRFEVWFDIDGNKRLMLSSRDIRTGRMVLERIPIVQLS